MEGLETATTATPAPAAAPAPAPATPAPAPAPAPASMGSDSSKFSLKESLKELNPTEVLFGILGVWALFSAIYYYKYNTAINKSLKNDIENKIDDLNIKLGDVTSALERDKVTSQQPMEGFF